MKRLLSVFLLLATLLSLFYFPVSALEEETGSAEETLPSSTTLVGTKHLPPICNQGEVGCCSSAAIAYMQFTNAVSHYIEANEPDKTFDPSSGEEKYLMSPKFTYFLSGSGTAYVYNILLENGCLTMDCSSFAYGKTNNYMVHNVRKPKLLVSEACSWSVQAGEMETAFEYRLKNYEQIWMNDVYKVDGKVQVTNTEIGKQLIEKIKRSLLDGNVVVTGGLSSVWTGYRTITKKGSIAKKGEQALAFSQGTPSGGHQVCIVGYDDDAECRVEGVTLKGAFLVANSWGTEWKNDGYVWLMYDALNEVSEYPELNFENRYFTMDQFCFVDWRTDIVSGKPDLYVEVTVTAEDRDTVYLETLRQDTVTSTVDKETYFMFRNQLHPTPQKDDHKHGTYLNFAGEADGEATEGVLAFSYNDLLTVEEGKQYSDYKFGFSLQARKGNYTVHSAVLKNAQGIVVAEMDLQDREITGTTEYFYFEQSVYKVTVPTVEGEGYRVEGFEGYYAKDSKVEVVVLPEEGYTLTNAAVKLSNGQTVQADKNGVCTITVTENLTVAMEVKAVNAAVKGYQAYVTAERVELYIQFAEEIVGKTVTISCGDQNNEVKVGSEAEAIIMSKEALEEKITVKSSEKVIAEYTLKDYLIAVVELDSVSTEEKAVANAFLIGGDYTQYLTDIKE